MPRNKDLYQKVELSRRNTTRLKQLRIGRNTIDDTIGLLLDAFDNGKKPTPLQTAANKLLEAEVQRELKRLKKNE